MRFGNEVMAASAASSPRGCPPRPSHTAISHDPSSSSRASTRSCCTVRGPFSIRVATLTASASAEVLPVARTVHIAIQRILRLEDQLTQRSRLGEPIGGLRLHLREALAFDGDFAAAGFIHVLP